MNQTNDYQSKLILERREICSSITDHFAFSMPKVRFSFSEIDTESLFFYDRLDAEVKSIYDSPRARKGRSIFSIRDHSFRGMIAEAWYIQNNPFPGVVSWTTKRWHDVIVNESKYAPLKGTHIEIKTVSEWNKSEINKKIDATVWANWNTSSFISVFLTNWDSERDLWFKTIKSKGEKGTFVNYVESGKSDVWWEYYGTKCIDSTKKIANKRSKTDI